MKKLSFFVLLVLALINVNAQETSSLSLKNLLETKYTSDKVWDVQRAPAYPVVGKDWVLSGLKNALDATGANIDWGKGRYLMFALETNPVKGTYTYTDDVNNSGKAYNISLKLYENSGALVKVVGKWGKIIGMGDQGFMYEVEGRYGTFFSNVPVNKSSVIKYKPILAEVTKLSDVGKSNVVAKTNDLPKVNMESSFINAKYTKDKVWDVQRSPAYPVAGQDWTLSGLNNALDFSGKPIDWGNGRYLMVALEATPVKGSYTFSDDINNSGKTYTISLQLFESNGTMVKVVSKWGKIIGMGAQGFMYEVEGQFGTFFSTVAYNTKSVVKYRPTLAVVTKLSELDFVKAAAKQAELPKVVTEPSQPSQGQIAVGYYTLTARCSGKVLDVLDASTMDGAKIQQWKLNGNVAQHWKIDPVKGAPGYYTLTSRCSGKVLDVLDASKLDGAKIQQWKLNGNIAQHWKIDPVNGAPGYFILTSRCSGKVLDVLDASTQDGAKIQQWSLNGNNAQHWKLDMVK